jgi:DMSO/TMAO reductase YedYZ molybdopterin-dependent catalytic subunit
MVELAGMHAAKLLATKTAWARERRLLVPSPRVRGRLPPGQTLTRDLPVLDLGSQPNLAPRDWRLEVGGLVVRPMSWNLGELAALGEREARADIHCVTGWSSFDVAWRGVPAIALLRRVWALPEARWVILKSHDAYLTSLPLEDFAAETTLIATHLGGASLPRAHGGPARLVVPHLYFWKSAKWLRRVWLTDRPVVGTWEARGYHERGDPWAQQRYG